MSDPRHLLGLEVESAVAEWLTRAGWAVVARRARSPGGGEIDIVAVDTDGVLVAVEVRARRNARAGTALESVDRRRINRLRRTLGTMAAAAPAHRGLRIDVVSAEPVRPGDARWRLSRTAGVDAG
jgi:putative endonuclease